MKKELREYLDTRVQLIETMIKEDSFEKDGKRYVTGKWSDAFHDKMWDLLAIVSDGRYDGNMAFTRMMACIYAAWFTQICYAKSKDKRRPKEHRKMLTEARKQFQKDMREIVNLRGRVILNFPPQKEDK